MEQIEKDKLFKKVRLIYSGELYLFVLVFLTIGILKLTGVVNTDPLRTSIIAIITTLGSSWLVTDFFWTLKSPKRRERNPLLDKAIMLPLAVYVITFNIICFINWNNRLNWDLGFYRIGFSCILFYGAIAYAFLGTYYLKRVHPLILENYNEEIAQIEKEEQEKLMEETKVDEGKEDK